MGLWSSVKKVGKKVGGRALGAAAEQATGGIIQAGDIEGALGTNKRSGGGGGKFRGFDFAALTAQAKAARAATSAGVAGQATKVSDSVGRTGASSPSQTQGALTSGPLPMPGGMNTQTLMIAGAALVGALLFLRK